MERKVDKDYYVIIVYKNKKVVLKGKNYFSQKKQLIFRRIYKRFYGNRTLIKKGKKGKDYPLKFILIYYSNKYKKYLFSKYFYDEKKGNIKSLGFKIIPFKEYEKIKEYLESIVKGEI